MPDLKRLQFAVFLFLMLTGFTANTQDSLPAFPGAEGYGKFATGGRGGKVYYVTSLDDNSSVGTLRYAINQTGPRVILFKVSGTIQLKSALKITKGDLTIAGQTAPGDGISLRDYPVTIDASNVIIRFMRFRMGDETNQEADALGGRYYKNIIIDHCSVSWSVDECASFYDNENFTLQWCILSESLRNSVHDKGAHGYGGIWGGKNASFHHNLLADHDSRNPRFCGSRYSNKPALEIVDFRNNVLYNWRSNTIYGGEGGNYNIVNNYFKAGPATSSSVRSRILQPYADDGGNSQPAGIYGKYYITGNYVVANASVTADNWQGVTLHSTFTTYAPGVTKSNLVAESEFNPPSITNHSAEAAYQKVADYAGACLVRDSVDLRIIHDLLTGTATFITGGNGSTNGIIDTQSAVGGWPGLASKPAPADSDNDGMPDTWESAKGLNSQSNTDASLKTVDGNYTNLEVYLNSLVAGIVAAQNQDAISTFAAPSILPATYHRIWFNAVTNEIHAETSAGVRRVEVYSPEGRLLRSLNFNAEKVAFSIADLQNGIYIVRVLDARQKFGSDKILKL